MLKVELMRGGDGAVVAGFGRSAGEAAGAAVEFGGGAGGFVAPGPGRVGHKADAIGAVAVVEPFDLDGAVTLRELRGEGDVAEGIAGGGAPEGELVEAPLLNVTGFCRRDNWLCGEDFRVQGGGQGGGRAELQEISAVHWILSPANVRRRDCLLYLKIMSQK